MMSLFSSHEWASGVDGFIGTVGFLLCGRVYSLPELPLSSMIALEICSLEADWSSSYEDFMRVSVLDGLGFEHIYVVKS